MLVRLSAVLALQVASGSFLLLGQASTITGPPHLELRLLSVLEGRQRRAIDNGARTRSSVLWHGGVGGQAARDAVVQACEGGFGNGTTAIDRDGAICNRILHCGAADGGLGEGGALATIDAVCSSSRALRGRVRVRASVGGARGQT